MNSHCTVRVSREQYWSPSRRCASMVKFDARYRSVCVLCGWPIASGMSEVIQIECTYYMEIQFFCFLFDFLSCVVYVYVMNSHSTVRVCRVILLLNSTVCINGKVCCSVSLFVCSLWMAYRCWFCHYQKTSWLVSPGVSQQWCSHW